MEVPMVPRASKMKIPKCAQCRNHNQIVPRKGHKNRCPWSKCTCTKCLVTCEKRQMSATRQRMRREPLEEDQIGQQEEVQLLLNLKSTIEKKDKCKGSQETASDGKQKYRFSGNIQNNMFYPANPQLENEAIKPKDIEPEGTSDSPPVDLFESEYDTEMPLPSTCPFCPCNHREMILPPTQQMPMFNPEEYHYMPHQLPNALASPSCNHPLEQPLHNLYNPNGFLTRFPVSFVSQSADCNFTYQYQPPTNALYPFNHNPVNQQSNNPGFASNDQSDKV